MAPTTKSAASLAKMINAYSVTSSPRTLSVPNAKQLAGLRDVTAKGSLIHKHLTHIEGDGVTRSFTVPSKGKGLYTTEANDGDIHFCLGTSDDSVHIPCELQHGKDWVDTFNQAIGSTLEVSGFFRCLFEHPGISGGADAHIFEIHPVRAVDFGSGTQAFDVDVPDDAAIHPWSDKLNTGDAKVEVEYDDSADTLTFSKMPGSDTNYVRVDGTVDNIDLRPGSAEPAQFVFTSSSMTNPLTVWCMKGTSASRQLEAFKNGDSIEMVALRNIDLVEALNGHYKIGLLGIDIQAAT